MWYETNLDILGIILDWARIPYCKQIFDGFGLGASLLSSNKQAGYKFLYVFLRFLYSAIYVLQDCDCWKWLICAYLSLDYPNLH